MATYKADILIVDDAPENLKLLSKMLAAQGYKVRSVTSGDMALRVTKAAQPDLILLDIRMPDLDGYQVCQQLKSETVTRDLPVIFLSALDEPFDKVRAFQVGGIDYITKPFQVEEVLARIETQLSLQTAQRSLQNLNRELERRVRQRTQQLEREIAARQVVQEQLLHVALHDELTSLPNRAFLMQRLRQVLAAAHQDATFQFALLLLDCDRFKVVNNSLGHLIGDQLLIAMARRLQACVPVGSTVARLGGDEFILLIESTPSLDHVTQIADRIQVEMRLPFQLERHEFLMSVSIGLVFGHSAYAQPEHLLRDADAAMYEAKAKGKARYAIFNEALHRQALNRFQLEAELQQAIDKGNFFVCYQPIVTLDTGELVGFEALVRWQHCDWGLVSPGEVVPLAEEAGIVGAIDLWMLEEVCHQLALWQREQLLVSPFRVSLNCSARHFMQPEFIAELDRALAIHQLDGRWLKVEITERELMTNAEMAIACLRTFRERGLQVAIDDFGTGYSCLGYLQRFPIDTLKIDRSFVIGLTGGDSSGAIVRAIIALAESLRLTSVAEGVETPEQRQRLLDLGCQQAQGYLFAQPMLPAMATALLQRQHQRLPLSLPPP